MLIERIIFDIALSCIEAMGRREPLLTFDNEHKHDGDCVKTDTSWLICYLNDNACKDTGSELICLGAVKCNGSKAGEGFDPLVQFGLHKCLDRDSVSHVMCK